MVVESTLDGWTVIGLTDTTEHIIRGQGRVALKTWGDSEALASAVLTDPVATARIVAAAPVIVIVLAFMV